MAETLRDGSLVGPLVYGDSPSGLMEVVERDGSAVAVTFGSSGGTPQEGTGRDGSLIAFASSSTVKYLVRGYRYNHLPSPDFEEWVSISYPPSVNPSGEPVRDLVVVAIW
jgi:hypothetical protein